VSEARIVITRSMPGDPAGRLARAGFDDVWINPRDERLPRVELLTAIRGAHGVLVTPADMHVDAEFFDAAGSQLRVVSAYAVGVDNIDVREAKRRGIIVGHTPNAVTEPTADMAWLLLLGAARLARQGLDLACSGGWTGVRPNDPLGARLVGKTLLIIGPGRIGAAVARRSVGWNMKVIYAARGRHEDLERPPISATWAALEEGLRTADFVSIHCPLTEQTRHLIDAARLSLMKPTSILINTARGAVIDEAALVEALKAGTIAAAGLDVYEHEPRIHPGLVALENVFLMPHWGSATVEDRMWMTRIAVDNIIAVLAGHEPPHAFS
jgi:lactate dehydrogenase-like 2-hydroxyacid dehydrogenase